MSKHTPGPWHSNNKVGFVFAKDCRICVVGDFRDKELLPWNKDRWLADSKLIAAAPVMHAALIEARRTAISAGAAVMSRSPDWQERVERLLDCIDGALAKAEGRI